MARKETKAAKVATRERPDYSTMSVAEKKRLVARIYVTYPRVDKLVRKIEEIHKYSKLGPEMEPRGMFIKGMAGVGKSKIAERYAERFPRYDEEERTVVPILVITIPESATVKGMASEMLDALGDPRPDSGSKASLTRRLRNRIKDCGVELIIADEFQHFIDRDSNKVLHEVSDWLKVLMDKTRRPIALIGMPNSDRILEANEQLKRRFTLREELGSFKWKTAKHQNEFRDFLKFIDGKLPFNNSSNLADPKMAFRFYYATNGVTAYVMLLVRAASELAFQMSMESLNLDLLAKAYDKELRKSFPKKQNPFRAVDIDKLKIAPIVEKHEVPGATNKRVRAKDDSPKASELLKRRG